MITERLYPLLYDTWGSYGQYELSYIILPDNTVIDPRKIVRELKLWKGMKAETTIEEGRYRVRIRVENNNSNKNSHFKVIILSIDPEPDYIIRVVEYKSSKKTERTIQLIRKNGEVENLAPIVDVKSYTVKKEKYIYEYKEVEEYVEINERKHVIRREREYLGRKLADKPILKIRRSGSKLIVYGDTYYVRNELKSLGFKWNSILKYWYGEADVDFIKEVLGEKAIIREEAEKRKKPIKHYL